MGKLNVLMCDSCPTRIEYDSDEPDEWGLVGGWVLCPTCLQRVFGRVQAYADTFLRTEGKLFAKATHPRKVALSLLISTAKELRTPTRTTESFG